MNIRRNLEVGGPDDRTEKDTHGGPAITQDGNKAVTNITKRGQETQGEESGGGD